MRLLLASIAALSAMTALATANETIDVEASVRPITEFRIGSDQTQFGPLEFVGGVEIRSATPEFGAISGLLMALDQERFTAVTDTGFWLTGTFERADTFEISDVMDLQMWPIADADGPKQDTDAEALTIDVHGNRLISFERQHRIEAHEFVLETGRYRLVSSIHPPVPAHELRRNQGFESLAVAPVSSIFPGAVVGVTEMSLDRNRDIMAFLDPLDGPSFEFSVKRENDFAITDIEFLPDGDLIVLERRFAAGQDIAMRLRRIDDEDIAPRTTVQPVTLMEADLNHQIDNMEALSITTDRDGTPRLTLASDDNLNFFQRNLVLEFRLNQPLAD